jgi:hypothetical protein
MKAACLALCLVGCDSFQNMALSQFADTYKCSGNQATAELADGGGIFVTGCGRTVKYSCSESTAERSSRRSTTTSSTSECHEVDGGPTP